MCMWGSLRLSQNLLCGFELAEIHLHPHHAPIVVASEVRMPHMQPLCCLGSSTSAAEGVQCKIEANVQTERIRLLLKKQLVLYFDCFRLTSQTKNREACLIFSQSISRHRRACPATTLMKTPSHKDCVIILFKTSNIPNLKSESYLNFSPNVS